MTARVLPFRRKPPQAKRPTPKVRVRAKAGAIRISLKRDAPPR
jgi:hypothetical protein